MFSKILIATDSSPSSLSVVGCARSLRAIGAKECVLAQCFTIREHVPFPHQIKAYIESMLNQQKEILEKDGLVTTVVVDAGLPGTLIPRMAAERGCSMIVVGSHGHNLVSEIFLGGTATAILHHATRPILIVRLKADKETGHAICAGEGCDFTRHVLYVTDFSDHAQRAFAYVGELVAAGARRVTLLHVQDQTRLDTHLEDRLAEFNAIDRERLEMLKARLEEMGDAEIAMEVPYGSPIDEILKRTREGRTGLVVMGTHGRGFVSELFLGSVSHNVARHSEAPVLLIPGQREDT